MSGVHLVGSVPMADSATVLRTCAEHLAGHISRLPDGETGSRANWIAWQRAVFSACGQLQTTGDEPTASFRLKPGIAAAEVSLGDLGYAAAAHASYEAFARLKSEGAIPAQLRFQVSLPTPLAPVQLYIDADDRAAFEPIYERAMQIELDGILDVIPHDQLAIQWDTAVEFGVLEGVFPAFFDNPFEAIVERLLRLGLAVPETVELGYHLCYGDAGHKHFVEPSDTTWLTEVANAICLGLDRSLDWLHLPVPRSRHDDAYFAPLAKLQASDRTELYLGLLHATDGLDGARARVAAAQRVLDRKFGVATECGFGRRTEASLEGLLALHVQTCELLET